MNRVGLNGSAGARPVPGRHSNSTAQHESPWPPDPGYNHTKSACHRIESGLHYTKSALDTGLKYGYNYTKAASRPTTSFSLRTGRHRASSTRTSRRVGTRAGNGTRSAFADCASPLGVGGFIAVVALSIALIPRPGTRHGHFCYPRGSLGSQTASPDASAPSAGTVVAKLERLNSAFS